MANDFLVVTPVFFTSIGKVEVACNTRFWVSIVALSKSVPMSKVTDNDMFPSPELVDCMYSMFSTPFTFCSMGVATACSTLRALAPR